MGYRQAASVTDKKIVMKCVFRLIINPILKNATFFVMMCILQIALSTIEGTIFFRLIMEIILDVYMMSFILSLIPDSFRYILSCLFSFIAYLLVIVELESLRITGQGISPSLLQLFIQTNTQEATEAFQTYFPICDVINNIWWVFVIAVSHFVIYRKCKQSIQEYVYRRKWNSFFCFSIGPLLIISFFCSLRNKEGIYRFLSANSSEFQHLSNDILVTGFYSPEYKLMYSIKAVQLANENIERLETSTLEASSKIMGRGLPHIVFIIGESYNKQHSELYGYKLHTTPNQVRYKTEGSLIPFTNVVSSWNYTYESFTRMFSTYSIGDEGDWYDYPLFPSLFKKSGYHVTFITNQFVKTIAENRWDYSAGIIFNTPKLSSAQFDCRNTGSHKYDDGLICDYDSLKVFETDNNLTIFHLYGQHVDYRQRYPEHERLFTPDVYDRNELTPDQIEILADYDNATLYNDKILCDILTLYKDKNAIVVYCPDHGEQCFDGNKMFGRSYSEEPNSIKQQFEIPFWIWGSSEFIRANPSIWERIKEVKDNAYMTDNIPHLLLSLGGITTESYNPKNDILSPFYNDKRPRLLRGTINYDEVINCL